MLTMPIIFKEEKTGGEDAAAGNAEAAPAEGDKAEAAQ